MFDPRDNRRVFGMPIGVDFAAGVVEGLLRRTMHLAPEEIARIEIFTNSGRMQRQIRDAFDAQPAMLLPRIQPITALGVGMALRDVPPAASSLRMRLQLSQFISALLKAQPDLAPRAAIYDLADSLASLLSEMHDEGTPPSAIMSLDVPDASGHWKRNLRFIQLIEQYFGDAFSPSAEARQRIVVERLVGDWQEHPPEHPILIAGSTGSRGTTAMLMRAVAALPQGAIILPGFDFDQPAHVWNQMIEADEPADDHPQYRYVRLLRDMGLSASSVSRWADIAAPCLARNALASLALRPAPVTDQWRSEGPAFKGIAAACDGLSLIEAPSPRIEGAALALAVRAAIEDGKNVAVVTPDRNLTRQLTAALDRWDIEPDDSAGAPLAQTAPGRLFRHTAALFGRKLTLETLIVLLKHPLVLAGSELRGMHLLWTRELELWARRRGPAFPTPDTLRGWVAKHRKDDGRGAWIDWMCDRLLGHDDSGEQHLSAHLAAHIALTRDLVSGPDGTDAELWAKAAGRAAALTVSELEAEAMHGGEMSARDYESLIHAVLSRGEVRDPGAPRADVKIFGTLEARVLSADLVILAGLNEGIWPAMPPPDQWLSRDMRRQAGLTSPEQRVGLSAHDFQIGLGAPEVILSRAVRDQDAQTVPSRWVNRLVNLLGGVSADGAAALDAMRQRGERWVALAETVDRPEHPVARARRPSPRPPVAARPRQLSVTRVQKLILDPFAIYAEYVLRLQPLDPLRQSPEASHRGTIIHAILERFVRETMSDDSLVTADRLLTIADEVLEQDAAWPTARRLWRTRLAKIADHFVANELERRMSARPFALEVSGSMHLKDLDFTLRGTADRIDRAPNGDWIIYDYKTGAIPEAKAVKENDKQLMLEAVMLEAGAFEGIGKARVCQASYVGLGPTPKDRSYALEPAEIEAVLSGFRELIEAYQSPKKGYTSLRTGKPLPYANPYDHLARYGEWETSDLPHGEDLT